MSGRPWVKLATKLHTDPAMMTIPREALGNWCLCLSLAGANDDDGRLGTVAETAWHLRITEADVVALVDVMRGRLAVVGGVVTVRDWCQWQPPRDVTNAKRQADHRARKAVTDSNDVTPVTVTALDIEVDKEKEQEQETTPGPATAEPAPPPKPPAKPRPMFDAFVVAFGYDPAKPAARVKGLAGDFDARCGRHARPPTPADWRKWVALQKRKPAGGDAPWGKFVKSHNATESFLAWWDGEYEAARATNGHDSRFWFQTPAGGWSLRAPSLVKLPAPYSPDDPTTWPADMRTTYASRIYTTDDGREAFA